MQIIAAYSYRSHGLPHKQSRLLNSGYIENFTYDVFDSQEEYHNEKLLVEALNLFLILHGQHEVLKED